MNRKDAFYFPHDSNAKDDPKIVMLVEQLGLEGYGIYWVLVETLRDQPDYRYPLALLSAIARRYATTKEKVEIVVMNYGLFSVTEDGLFFLSDSLCRRMLKYEETKEKRSIAGRIGRSRQLECSGQTPGKRRANAGQTPAIAGLREEKRREDILSSKREKERPLKSDSSQGRFDLFWEKYPRKDGKKDALKAWEKQQCFNGSFDTIMANVEKFKTLCEGKERQYIPLPATWIRGERWNDEMDGAAKVEKIGGFTF